VNSAFIAQQCKAFQEAQNERTFCTALQWEAGTGCQYLNWFSIREQPTFDLHLVKKCWLRPLQALKSSDLALQPGRSIKVRFLNCCKAQPSQRIETVEITRYSCKLYQVILVNWLLPLCPPLVLPTRNGPYLARRRTYSAC
jgi:hypothetical protein